MGDVPVAASGYLGYVTAGYVIAALSLAGYLGHLRYRARRARARARAIGARRS